jgi:hypothetical protein
MVVAYTKLNSENKFETVIHQECESKDEAIQVANELVLDTELNEVIFEVLRGVRVSDTDVKYHVLHAVLR